MDRVVLVTGGRGFIGRHCLPLLRARGFEVHATTSANLADPSAHWHQTDLLDHAQVTKLLRELRPSHLLHLAWLTTPGQYWTSLANLDWLAAGITLFREFEASAGRRATVAGTCAEYDWSYGYCQEELTPIRPASIYGASKASVSNALFGLAASSSVSAASGRVFFPFGPGEDPRRLVSSVCLSLLLGEEARCTAGTQLRDFLYVEDVASALVALLDSDVEGPVNIASAVPVSVESLVSRVAAHLDRQDLLRFGAVVPAVPEAPLVLGSVKRLREQLDWQPEFDLDTAVDRTISWWRRELEADGSSQTIELAYAG